MPSIIVRSDAPDTIRVWVGCLSCYNAGRLTGDWVEALEATEWECPIGNTDPSGPHEEFWVMDYEDPYGLLDGECSPMDAQAAAEAVAAVELDEEDPTAVAAYWDIFWSGRTFSADAWADQRSDFQDRFAGRWDSWQEYADDFARECLGMDSWPETAQQYFNWNSYANDLRYEYSVAEFTGAEFYILVFRSA